MAAAFTMKTAVQRRGGKRIFQVQAKETGGTTTSVLDTSSKTAADQRIDPNSMPQSGYIWIQAFRESGTSADMLFRMGKSRADWSDASIKAARVQGARGTSYEDGPFPFSFEPGEDRTLYFQFGWASGTDNVGSCVFTIEEAG